MEQFDAVVIGAGQAGVPLAIAFAEAGRRTAIIERAHVGGSCINFGCTPTKTVIHIAKVAQTVRRAGEYGIETTAPQVDMRKVRDLKRAIVNEFREGTADHIRRTQNLALIEGNASFTGPHDLEVDGRQLQASLIVINTGTRAFIPPISGLADVPYRHDSTILELDHVPETLTVLGGGYIGLEFAQLFSRLGSRVTVLEAGPRFLPREDQDVADEIRKILQEDGIDIRLDSSARSARHDGEQFTLQTEHGDIKSDELLVAVGRTPNTDDLGLQAAGIQADARGYIEVDSSLRTNVEGVYAAGDVNGGPAFTHISYDDYRILRANLLEGGDRTTEGRIVPYAMYIDPELGRIGLGEDEATRHGRKFRVAKMPMTSVARADEMNESRGFMKALVEEGSGRLLGAAVLGVNGGEIMSMVQLAMLGGLTASDLHQAVLAHPTLAESLNNLFS